MGKTSTKPRILGLVLIPAGYLLGIFSTLPWPWKLRLRWIYLIRQCTVHVMSIAPLFLRYQQAQNIRFGMGKRDTGTLESMALFERVLQYLETEGTSIAELKQAVDELDGDHILSHRYAEGIATVCLGQQAAEELIRDLTRGTLLWDPK